MWPKMNLFFSQFRSFGKLLGVDMGPLALLGFFYHIFFCIMSPAGMPQLLVDHAVAF